MFRINQQLSIYLLLTVFFFSSYAQQPSYKEGEILVRFAKDINNKNLTVTQRNSILASAGTGQVKRTLKSVPDLSLVELPVGLSVEDAINTLKGKSGIVHAQPNFIYKALAFPNDTRFNEQWALNNTGQTGGTAGADIDAPKAWDIITDSNVIVAVIDSGVFYTHPDLAANMWVNQAEYNGTTGVDDDGNGFVDDIYGYDFCTYDGKERDSDPIDDNIYGHGTHVAGIIGAVGNNGLGVTGVCWDVKIMALKLLDYEGNGYTEDAIDSINYAVQMGAKVLNNSWADNEYDQELKNIIETANANGVIFVAGAGNNGGNNDVSPVYPASYVCDNIISVMATDHDDNRSKWTINDSSNYGLTTVDLAAPGSDILGCFLGDSYYYLDGTSMAAPHVAGACALVWAANPQLTYLEVKDYILQGAEKLDSLDGKCVTGGRLNLWRAVKGLSDFPSLTLTKNVVGANCVSPFEPLIGNYLNYEICYDANGDADTNVVLVDFLPEEVNEPNYISDGGEYDPDTNSVTWIVGDITGDDSGTYRIQVAVNKWAKPGGTITNRVWMQGDHHVKEYILDSNVCPWGPPRIYVDKDANGYENGTSWIDAYPDLQQAFTAARNIGPEVKNAIWVAEGIYKPVNDIFVDNYQDYNFVLLEGVGLFGHFGGIGTYETNISQRNFADANNETVLEGLIYYNEDYHVYYKVYKVVTATDINNAVLDGFTVRGSDGWDEVGAGVCLENSDISILNCKFSDNYYGCGIEVLDHSFPYIHNCAFVNNTESAIIVSDNSCPTVTSCIFDGNYDENKYGISIYSNSEAVVEKTKFNNHKVSGIYVSNGGLTITDCNFVNDESRSLNISSSNATVDHCLIVDCGNNGIQGSYSNLTVNDTVIRNSYENALSASDCNLTVTNSILSYSRECGIALDNVSPGTIKNNWIYNNGTNEYAYVRAGILLKNHVSAPLIRNNTIVSNGQYGIYRENGVAQSITNCILWGDPNGELVNCTATYSCVKNGSGGTNIESDPCFYDADANNFHIKFESSCKDAGTGTYPDETDIDGEPRTAGSNTDMGADEFYWPKADYNRDEIVNFIDYIDFADKWFCNDPCISLDTDPNVNIYDLALFCEDWLWQPKWGTSYLPLCMSGGGTFLSESVSPQVYPGGLMLSDISESLNTMPDSLYSKVEKFYVVKPYVQPVTIPQASIEEILEWIDELWESGVMKEANTTYEEYLEFRKSVEESAPSY